LRLFLIRTAATVLVVLLTTWPALQDRAFFRKLMFDIHQYVAGSYDRVAGRLAPDRMLPGGLVVVMYPFVFARPAGRAVFRAMRRVGLSPVKIVPTARGAVIVGHQPC